MVRHTRAGSSARAAWAAASTSVEATATATSGRSAPVTGARSQIGPEHLADGPVPERGVEPFGVVVAGPHGEQELMRAAATRPVGGRDHERATDAAPPLRARDDQGLDVAAPLRHHRVADGRVV